MLGVDRDRSVSVLYRFQRCHQLAEWSLRVLSIAQRQIMTWSSSGRARNFDKVLIVLLRRWVLYVLRCARWVWWREETDKGCDVVENGTYSRTLMGELLER